MSNICRGNSLSLQYQVHFEYGKEHRYHYYAYDHPHNDYDDGLDHTGETCYGQIELLPIFEMNLILQ